ncbi:MAG: hypothetical protein NXY57DRAFT_1040441 [Lentinula lateritia]|nr:MAG: hypothetical protein NXY57DRAFT_1040441 [Lentinula lateritia]
MSVEKRLGQGGTQRHRKISRHSITVINRPTIRRLARRGGVKRNSGRITKRLVVPSRFLWMMFSVIPLLIPKTKIDGRHDEYRWRYTFKEDFFEDADALAEPAGGEND